MKTNKNKLVPDSWNETYHHISYVLPNGKEYYHVERWQLDVIREDCNVFGIPLVHVSNLIAHLQGKFWIKKRHLYEMAEIIRKYKPDNKINWNHTYYYIEIKSQLDELQKQMARNDEFEYHSKIEGMVTTDGEQMMRNAEKFEKAASAYITENQLFVIPENFAGVLL